ncbi:MAG: bifunctional aldolase/short-chain dehydrogenase [Magnetococcales bacterium]|nr:bifunctional aldolase/short-chain dehydrogenase [Magnetococcales bacterium]
MKSRWNDQEAAAFVARHEAQWGQDLALRTYTGHLLGSDRELVLHGGGNTSVKCYRTGPLGEPIDAIHIKASGCDLATMTPQDYVPLNLGYLRRLSTLTQLSDARMVSILKAHTLEGSDATPSIEALLHCFIPHRFIDHTHADAILTLGNREGGSERLREALGEEVILLDYVHPGFQLSLAAAQAFSENPQAKGMVLLKHGLITWGESAREAYEATVEMVTRVEKYLATLKLHDPPPFEVTSEPTARSRYRKLAPRLRGALAVATGDDDQPWQRMVLQPLITPETLKLADHPQGREIALTPPLTSDHLIRTKALPLWLDNPEEAVAAVAGYSESYDAYFERHREHLTPGVKKRDSKPRMILIPGVGAAIAGSDLTESTIARDITCQTITVKNRIAQTGRFEGLDERHLFDMEYFSLQHAKLNATTRLPLQGSIALVTGAAGAIGAGICQELLQQGALVAGTDLAGEALEALSERFKADFGERFMGVALDVTDPEAVKEGFGQVIDVWGGVDLVIINAGLAHVSSLATMDTDRFKQLMRVNTEGTLHILGEAARLFELQGTGGDIVLISTKNVFAPGANFGAYSATKAASHQLARIASLELASQDVRVNMVAPDGVFSHGANKSGLWAEVGPDRMRARGLDEDGLEAYYQNRNMLKAKITATHVARAVLYFATRQSPTTGATLPVDGGLPDATPR